MTIIFWGLFTYCLAERLFEIWLSRRNRRRMSDLGYEQREGSMQLGAMVVMHTAWYIALIAETVLAPSVLPEWIPLTAAIVFTATQALRFWALKTLGENWNVSVMTPESGVTRFVANGPYKYIRHPNYAVVILELATLPLVGNAPITAIAFTLLNGWVLKHRIALEEEHLFKIPGYVEVMAAKNRFVPRILS